ncbi:MAG: reverse transcriptase domain-containing protein [Roseburia sp.]|nr:reverse transcriptase domain-containing protein [Roseburia sp.]
MKIEFVENAYRKLKGSVYWDKTLPFIRTRIADFEGCSNVHSELQKIADAFDNDDLWNQLQDKILNSIEVLTFPKSVSSPSEENSEEPIVISNITCGKAVVEKYNNFLDMCIEGQIMGVLWVLMIGKDMDDRLIAECYGNRLNENLKFNGDNVTASPNLFKPYYEQYVSWRDRGLQKVEEYVNERRESVVITMLDLSRYYYSVDLSERSYFKLTNSFVSHEVEKEKVNKLIYNILKKYSSFFNNGSVLLPIGFLPSNIISNYFLNELDWKMKTIDSIIYYGRYVDDMLLVSKINKEDELWEKVQEKGVDYVAKYMLLGLTEAGILERAENINEYFIKEYKMLKIQRSKFRFFYMNKDGNDELLRHIRKDIAQNSSEFNFVPEIFVEKDTKAVDVLKIERDDTVNKIRAVKKSDIDKYSLSKLLARKLLMSKFENENSIDYFIGEMDKLLDYKVILSNYTLWETILNYYVVNGRLEEIANFSRSVVGALCAMDEEVMHIDEFEYLSNSDICTVKESLTRFYFSCVCRSLALVWGQEVKEIILRIIKIFSNNGLNIKMYSENDIKKCRKAYCISGMINRSLLPLSMSACMSAFRPSDDYEMGNMHSLAEYIRSNKKVKPNNSYKKYAPYIETPFDIIFTNLMKEIKEQRPILPTDKKLIEEMCKEYADNFGESKRDYLSRYIDVKAYDGINYYINVKRRPRLALTNVRVAVANVKMDFEEVIGNLEKKNPDRGERCKEIAEIVNEAIRYKADILIMPESYVPLEYLSILQKKASAREMVIICGIEHFKCGQFVYNLTMTLIPLVTDKFRYTIPFFHQKVYFSPEEKRAIEAKGYRCAEGDKYSLYCWRGINFTTYCCYELTSIRDRSLFRGKADLLIGVEWNKDTAYFGNIMESLSRDLYCYCVQSNMSVYGDSRIVQPKKSIVKDLLRVKGGENAVVLVNEVDVRKLKAARRNKISSKELFKPLPAGWNPK